MVEKAVHGIGLGLGLRLGTKISIHRWAVLSESQTRGTASATTIKEDRMLTHPVFVKTN
jgi:hypothetical protein